jgi:N-acetylmuramoyl-L-alanine amidase
MIKALRVVFYTIGLVVAVMFVQNITHKKFAVLEASAGNFSSDIVTIKTRERQLDCLANNIYHEAGYESFEGKVAVAQVTMNRAASGQFPSDVCGVVYQKSVIMEKVVCQFSWYCQGINNNKPINNAAYTESYEVAKKVLLEGFRLNILKDALYYHADYVNPQWPFQTIGKIGHHIFYKGNKNESSKS